MKTLYIIPLIMLIQLLNANELEWVDEQIKAIQPPRQGMENISKLKDPFVFLKKDDEKSKKESKTTSHTAVASVHSSKKTGKVHIAKQSRFNLSIILNKSAKINNKWYKQGDILNGHKILTIAPSYVILIKNKKQTILSMNSKNKKIKIKH